jgi:hypothetical protein
MAPAHCMLYFGRRFAETVGIDINRRSVAVASFNAELNGLPGVHCHLDNALTLGSKYGRFDLVTWNLPFNFIPVEYKDIAIDGYGGDLGIELCMQFIDTLPPLLKPAGVAHVAAVSPMLENGAFPLEDQLRDVLPRLRLVDCVLQVLQWDYGPTFAPCGEFHRQHRIKRLAERRPGPAARHRGNSRAVRRSLRWGAGNWRKLVRLVSWRDEDVDHP